MSVHVCRCVHNGREEFHIRYPGMTERQALNLADDINGGKFAAPPVPESEALGLLKQLRAWDMMDASADGPYWRTRIDALRAMKTEK
jgi:hypothetical protein